MENKKMVINTELDIIQYVNCVDNIVSKFFNDSGDYDPTIGVLHAMCIFYNLCVKESEFEQSVGAEVHDVWDIRDVAKNTEFIKEFNNAIRTPDTFSLNFNNAYKQAMDIVENKKNPINNIIELIKLLGEGLSESVNSLLNADNTLEAEINNMLNNEEATVDSEEVHEIKS